MCYHPPGDNATQTRSDIESKNSNENQHSPVISIRNYNIYAIPFDVFNKRFSTRRRDGL